MDTEVIELRLKTAVGYILLWLIVCAALGILLSGCATVKLSDGKFTAEHTSFMGYEQVGRVKLTTPSGATLEADALKADMAQGAEAIAEGVAKGLAAGIKP